MKTKVCSTCKKRKRVSQFNKNKTKKFGLSNQCKKCIYKVQKQSQRGHDLKFKYGMSLDDWQRMFNKQQGCCAICGKHQSELGRGLMVDHNHVTGKIRALLCNACNLTLGRIENINVNDFLDYLEKHND